MRGQAWRWASVGPGKASANQAATAGWKSCRGMPALSGRRPQRVRRTCPKPAPHSGSLPILVAMPRRSTPPLRVALALALGVGAAACQRAPPPQVDIYAQPAQDELAKVLQQARRGDRGAQRELGQRYYGGDGLPRDFAQAAEWWRKSATAGDDQAQVLLATQLFRGEGVAQDPAQALRWWRTAAE